MKQFQSYADYCDRINETMQAFKPTVTNNYMQQDEVERLIGQGRLYYEESDGGLLIYDDEVVCYLLYYYWNVDHELSVKRKDKMIASRIIYRKEKRPDQKILSDLLQTAGFRMDCRERQVVKTDVSDMKSVSVFSRKLFDNKGLRLVKADKNLVEGLRKVIAADDKLHCYEIPYLTDEEIVREGQDGRMVCVVNEDNEVVAVRTLVKKGTVVTPYMRILEGYRKLYGIAVVLSDYTDEYMKDNGLKYNGWIAEDNKQSIDFHLKYGRNWGDRYIEYHVLDKA